MLTLGLPLVFLLAENRKSLKEDITFFVGSCAAWGIGYAAMWGSKWILGSLITEENIIADALESVLFRVGAIESEAQANALEVIFKNIGANKMCLVLIAFIFVGVFIYGIWKKRTVDMKSVNISVFLCALLL